MNSGRIAIRVARSNPDHHLWNNHGTWWCHFTLHLPDFTKRRVRCSLATHSLAEARRRRNRLLAADGPGRPPERWSAAQPKAALRVSFAAQPRDEVPA